MQVRVHVCNVSIVIEAILEAANTANIIQTCLPPNTKKRISEQKEGDL
jgi:hypothetical protein